VPEKNRKKMPQKTRAGKLVNSSPPPPPARHIHHDTAPTTTTTTTATTTTTNSTADHHDNKKQKQQRQQKGTWRTLLGDQVEPPSVERWTHPERAGESSPPPVSPSPLLTSIAMPPSKTESTA
jgi:hypothetical protein